MYSLKSSWIVRIWLVTVFFISGLIINGIQLLILPLWYISHNTFRCINSVLSYSHWAMLTFAGEWWGQVDIKFYGKKEDYEKLNKEHVFALPNHRSDIDWLIGWTLCERVGILGGAKCYVKHALKFLPVIGWTWWFSEYLFLRRSWEEDAAYMKKSLERLKDFPLPFFLGVFPEGTRFTKAKHQNSLEFARSRNLPELKHHLYPRTKGVSITLKYLKDLVPAIYDIETAYPKDSISTVKHLLQGGKCEVHLFLRRIAIKDVPCSSDEEVSQWCQKLFVEKDKLMSDFEENGKFLQDRVELPRGKRNLIVVVCWNIALAVPIFYVIYSLLRSSLTVSLPIVAAVFFAGYIALRLLVRLSDSRKGSKFGLKQNTSKEARSETVNGSQNDVKKTD